MAKLVGIVGKAGAGKDTVAACFVTFGYQKYSFAKPIKDACALLFGWGDEHLHGSLKEIVDPAWGFSPRHAMQTLGTQWGRHCLRDDIWIQAARQFVHANGSVVIPDVRYPNEAQFIIDHGGTLVHVIRPNQHQISLNQHASETSLDVSQYPRRQIVNDRGLTSLDVAAALICGSIL